MDNKSKITEAFSMTNQIMTLSELFAWAKARRQAIDPRNLCKFCIPAVDDRLIGMTNNELTVIWAASSAGKTQVAINMVIGNAMKGKKVLFFMLEWDTDEIYQRYMQTQIMKEVRMSPIQFSRNMDMTGDIKKAEDKLFDTIPQNILDNVIVYRKNKIPDINEIVWLISAIESDIDMIVIDHAQYIAYADDQSENRAISQIMQTVKNITDNMRKPVVLFSHLRKKDSKKNYVTMEDLHWSSDLYKQANNVLLLESVTDSEWIYVRTKWWEYITRFIIAKNRAAIWWNRTKMYMLFDTNTQSYSREVDESFIDDLTNF